MICNIHTYIQMKRSDTYTVTVLLQGHCTKLLLANFNIRGHFKNGEIEILQNSAMNTDGDLVCRSRRTTIIQ